MKARNRPAAKPDDATAAVLAKIAAMPGPYRAMGERLHRLILLSAPTLQARVWYGMPGYARTKGGPVVCFFRADQYMTFGLTDQASFAREEGVPHQLLASAWFFSTLDEATEIQLAGIVRKATS